MMDNYYLVRFSVRPLDGSAAAFAEVQAAARLLGMAP